MNLVQFKRHDGDGDVFLARVLDAPAGKMRVAIDAAIDNGKV